MNIENETTINGVDWSNVMYSAKQSELWFGESENVLRVEGVDAKDFVLMVRNAFCCIEGHRITDEQLCKHSIDQLKEISDSLNAYFKAKKSTNKEA